MNGVPVVSWDSASGGIAGGSYMSASRLLLVDASLVEAGRRAEGEVPRRAEGEVLRRAEGEELRLSSTCFPFSCLAVG